MTNSSSDVNGEQKSKGYPSLKAARNQLRRVFPGLFVLGKVLALGYSKRSFLVTSGFNESVRRKKPCRADGSAIPWMNYAMIEFLEQRLTRELSVFEYGSGNSTLFLADKVRDIVSVECDKLWYDYIKDQMPENVTLLFAEATEEDYLRAIDRQERRFDIVIVDAEMRNECLVHAPNHLSGQGVVLLDDAARDEYQSGIDGILSQGFKQLPFNGLKAGGIRSYRTTVFYRADNCLGI